MAGHPEAGVQHARHEWTSDEYEEKNIMIRQRPYLAPVVHWTEVDSVVGADSVADNR
ncbi:hypothetical protein [Cobetia sp. L2A1]|uniref:hypothetical protein n=1 Tax=Cobetia sp. L2A1 TaxID=2686360 RepID=UPI00131DED08|nr:hypothetical protein [Cobetia sp. L2A1]